MKRKIFQFLAFVILTAICAFSFACDASAKTISKTSSNSNITAKTEKQTVVRSETNSPPVTSLREQPDHANNFGYKFRLEGTSVNKNQITERRTFSTINTNIFNQREDSPPNDLTFLLAKELKQSVGNFKSNTFYQRE